MSSPSSRRSDRSQGLKPESPLSDRSPRRRGESSKKSAKVHLSPKTPLPLPNSKEAPKHPRRYSHEKVTDFHLEEVHRPTDRVVHVDLEEIENGVRGGTPSSYDSTPVDRSLLNDSLVSSTAGPRTSTPRKSARKSRRAPESLLKKVLMKSASRHRANDDPRYRAADSDSSYATAPESNATLGFSPIRLETADGYRSANSTQRALFSQQGAGAVERPARFRPASRSASRSRNSGAPSTVLCQLVTPLAVHTSQEVNAVSATGQVLVISQTLVRSAHASSDVRKLMNHLAGKTPLISNEMSQVDIDHDNEHSKHEVFVGSNAILIQRISTIHRGRERNSFETDDRRTYRFICQGDLLPEDRRDKQSKPRHLTIIAESATVKDCEEINKTERVVLVFDAAEQPARVLAPTAPETSLMHADDLASRPSALKDSPVAFEEHVRVSDHSHINIVRKASVHSTARLWDEPLTELKEQRVYKQQLSDDADCEPVRITRSHSMTRAPTRQRSPSVPRRDLSVSRVERSRTPGRSTRNSSVLRPLQSSDELHPRGIRRLSEFTPSTSDLITCIASPIKDEPARREHLPRLVLDSDDTGHDSLSLPSRTTNSSRRSPDPKTLEYSRIVRSKSPAPTDASELLVTAGPVTPSPRTARTAATQTPTQSFRSHRSLSPYTHGTQTPTQSFRTLRSPSPRTARLDEETPRRSMMRTPSPYSRQRQQLLQSGPISPLRTARPRTPRTPNRAAAAPAVVVDEDTSAGSSQSPTHNRTPTAVSPRQSPRLATAIYQSPAPHHSSGKKPRRSSRDALEDEWASMLEATQATSPIAPSAPRELPSDSFASLPPTSPSRLGTKPFRSLRLPTQDRPRPSTQRRPLGPARSCSELGSDRTGGGAAPLPSVSPRFHPLRRAASELSLHTSTPRVTFPASLAAPANTPNDAITIAAPFRGQGYVPAFASDAQPTTTASGPMQPRIPRTTRPRSASTSDQGPVAVSASGSATRVSTATQARREFAMPHSVVGKPARSGSSNPQRNVELVNNPEDFDEGEILRKKLTLEAKINGHMWNLAVTFALKGERADMIRFVPKRVRIDDQTLWEETENWSQTSLTPVTGPRTAARGSSSYDQVLQQPVVATTGNASTSVLTQTEVRVSPKTTRATTSTASSASRSKRATGKKDTSKKSNDSKTGDKKTQNTHFI